MSRLFTSVLLIIHSSLCLAQSNERTVTFVVGDWEPYTSSQSNPEYKMAEDLVTAAYETQGYRVTIDYHPWSRAYRYVESGRYDGTFPWFKNDERESLFIFSESLFTQKIVFFYHIDSNFDWQKPVDLNNYHIGATQGYEVTRLLQSLGVNVEVTNEDQSNFIKLGKQRIDAYPAAVERGYYMMGTSLSAIQLNKLRIHPKPIIENDMYTMFSKHDHKRSERLSEALNLGIQQLIQSGEYQKIINVENQVSASGKTD
ncbi:substrate-binding periplasmic protein [Vibrio sp. T11.5]|uniref:substrate-binding periplasmic protein n=1 Tax=Vibrio sp. T11.5 TaxID=2998836 RepID=UPI0022CD6296|nr:transporter substrate-binding domain-containing protein [Vibrio sp. T11.5]MDA0119210.1 transporter substrate-binding domain-containing protein [Vibrio sp. T11.5]